MPYPATISAASAAAPCCQRLKAHFLSAAIGTAEAMPRYEASQSLVLLLLRNSQRLHLAVKMAALQAQYLGGAAHVAVVLIEFFEDVITLVGGACLVQGGGVAGRPPAAVAVNQ